MTLREIQNVLDAEVIAGHEDLEKEIHCAFAADLLSDVLSLAREGALLITGVTHPQVVYTANTVGLGAILFVRGKWPNEATFQLATQKKIPLLTTSYIMFETCGRLYRHGVKGCVEKIKNERGGK